MGRNKKKKNVPSANVDSSGEDVEYELVCAAVGMELNSGSNRDGFEERKDAENEDTGLPALFREIIDDDTKKSKDDDDDHNKNDEEDKVVHKKKEYRGNKVLRQNGAVGGKKKNKGKNDEEISGENGNGEAGNEKLVILREYPVEVLYCPVCSFPAEMCEFSGMIEKCRPWLLEHAADLADAEEKGRKRRILTEQGRLQKLLEGGAGPKHIITRNVIVELEEQMTKRTIVTGMDLFGFNLKDLSREWRKLFSAGVGVRKGEQPHEQSRLEIQGNVVERLKAMLASNYSIPKECVLKVVKEAGSKKKTTENMY